MRELYGSRDKSNDADDPKYSRKNEEPEHKTRWEGVAGEGVSFDMVENHSYKDAVSGGEKKKEDEEEGKH